MKHLVCILIIFIFSVDFQKNAQFLIIQSGNKYCNSNTNNFLFVSVDLMNFPWFSVIFFSSLEKVKRWPHYTILRVKYRGLHCTGWDNASYERIFPCYIILNSTIDTCIPTASVHKNQFNTKYSAPLLVYELFSSISISSTIIDSRIMAVVQCSVLDSIHCYNHDYS